MAEPEDVIAEGALFATRIARELWARRTARSRVERPQLRDVRRRLELFVAAVFPGAPEIGVAEPPAPLSWLGRMARRRTDQGPQPGALSSTDGFRVRLPASLDDLPAASILDHYRLLALEQAARVARGTPASVPAGDALRRDLYLLAEAATVDALLVRVLPRLAPFIGQARLHALHARPRPTGSAQERAVEGLMRVLLAADPASAPALFVDGATPDDSLRWAAARAAHVRELSGPYRTMVPVALWGTADDGVVSPSPSTDHGDGPDPSGWPRRSHVLPRRPRVREASPNDDDDEPGTWIVRADDPQEKVEDPAGLNRPTDRDQHADAGELADALSELPEARLVRTPDRVHEILTSEDPPPPVHHRSVSTSVGHAAIAYPEWDWRASAYRPRAAIVRMRVAEEGSSAWAEDILRRHAALLRRIRRDFERLRPRRVALRRQRDGAELDIDAMVEAHGDRRAGGPVDERRYLDTRPGRRDVAIALVVDASGSTDGWVSGTRRIIDVEKEAVLMVGEALAASGDPHAIITFCSNGPGQVDVRNLKTFAERPGSGVVRRRVAAVEPAGFTRAGASLRHATAMLMQQPARFRLLLVLSDGRPNDVDEYEGRYGIEDTRVAVMEARLQGVHCYCLTVDREAPRYASRIFGRDYAVLSRPERLPMVLTAMLRDFVRG
ncbi:MAG TPA: hypothetical protein VF461_01505 [Gemmatimonadaceae bacterium]